MRKAMSTWASSVVLTQTVFERASESGWVSSAWTSIRRRRAGSSSGGLFNSTGNEERKVNLRRLIFSGLHADQWEEEKWLIHGALYDDPQAHEEEVAGN
jgi:hypothetical protein